MKTGFKFNRLMELYQQFGHGDHVVVPSPASNPEKADKRRKLLNKITRLNDRKKIIQSRKRDALADLSANESHYARAFREVLTSS